MGGAISGVARGVVAIRADDALTCADGVASGDLAGEDADVGGVGEAGSSVPLASARSTAAPVIGWLEKPAMPWPIRDTASRLPPVAAPAPRSQALTPIRMRPRTSGSMAERTLRAGKAHLKVAASRQCRCTWGARRDTFTSWRSCCW